MSAEKVHLTVDEHQPAVIMTRLFHAPRRLVFEALTRPELVRRWYGPHGYQVTLCESDLRPGGAYRIVQRDPQGNEWGFRGVHKEIVPPERIVQTWIFEPMPDKEALVTMLLAEQDGKTTLTATTLFQSFEDRERYLKTGATEGASETYQRMDEVLRTLT
jgi:uncharacterized protein YndB with AHSA1/START domain